MQRAHLFLVASISFCLPAAALASSTTVDGTAVIYSAGSSSLSPSTPGGTAPPFINVAGDSYLTFGVTGTVILNVGTGTNSNNPDGVGAAVSASYNTGYGSISGIEAPDAGYLVGVFIGPGGPSGSAPTTLDYLGGGNASTSSTTYSPLLDQVFFIGDGLTGNGTGTTQEFFVPAGATELYLGISDACGYNGGPSCYSDNSGSFTVNSTAVIGTTAATPEPSSLGLLATAMLGSVGLIRRRFRA